MIKKFFFYKIFLISCFNIFILISIISLKKNVILFVSDDNNKSKIYNNCYSSFGNSGIKSIHLIITRFLIEFPNSKEFNKNLYNERYIKNGIRVMNKYLIPSLKNQSCQDFIWVLMIGNKINITNIQSLFNFNHSFVMKMIFKAEINNFIKNVTKGFDVLITTRIDYDDIIYYDAVNDVRKEININKPILLYGYNSGLFYLESEEKFYEYYEININGTSSIFCSLIVVLKDVNKIYTVYDIGNHRNIRNNLLDKYKSFGIEKINYEPAIFNSGGPKFIYVRQNFSHNNKNTYKMIKNAKLINFNLRLLY